MATIKTKRKRWPPNVGINNGNVRYRRQIPKDLGQVAGKTVYSEYLASLTPESSFEDACADIGAYAKIHKQLILLIFIFNSSLSYRFYAGLADVGALVFAT
jgi:hypothetical protein